MKKYLFAILMSSALIMNGCGSTSTTDNTTISSDLGNSIGSSQSEISGFGGYIQIELALKFNSSIDTNSFLIVHKINGVNYKLYTPSVLNNGSLMFVQEEIVIRPNTTSGTQEHTIEMVYYTNDVKQVYTFTVFQETEQSAANAIGTKAVDEYILLNPPVIP